MSAGICGKRLGFEEIFGSSSPSNKRARCSGFVGFGSVEESNRCGESKVGVLLRMFPSISREVVETIFSDHNQNIEDAVESLNALCLGDVSTSQRVPNNGSIPGTDSSGEPMQNRENLEGYVNPTDWSLWVDMFVQELMSAQSLNDAKTRAKNILDNFEKKVAGDTRASSEQEITTLREHLQNLLRDNHILKRAVAIQHERNLEQEEKGKEVEQLKHVIMQYQEQVGTLEMSNYTLKLHLERTQESSSIPGRFHPDLF